MTWDEALAIATEIRTQYPALHLLEIAREFAWEDGQPWENWHLIVSDARNGREEITRRPEWIGSREQWEEHSKYYRPPFLAAGAAPDATTPDA